MALAREQVEKELREAAAEFVGIEPNELDLSKKLRLEYGVSSIDAAELIMLIEDKYKLKIPLEEAKKILSAGDAIEYVMKNAK
ncbi:MAG: acyl carrier protein [Elusimicrobiota bacterium]|jgi:acyl carrier protein